ncbi:MAG TPA: D-alanine--D-alanine ligase family protein [bacterium]|nr:D-alanine--D-alanine ligase family protein [bacterium]
MQTIGLFFGGPSNEHEVSISSAKNIVANFPDKKYKLLLVFWDKQGKFYLVKNIDDLRKNRQAIVEEKLKEKIDIALLMTHGKNGEDGGLQSLLESQKIKYCGCRPLSSALCMDKGLFKQFLAGQGIKQVKFSVLDYNLHTDRELSAIKDSIRKTFKLPIYVKPANSGSSVGITKVVKFSQLPEALTEALKHDNKIVVEEGLLNPREIEVAVLGNKELKISSPGELQLAKDFYSYDDKYNLGQATVQIPAKLSLKQKNEIAKLAERVYKLCLCSGFARIDFFISDNQVYLNEINTLPGFTNISMYPMLMMNTGMTYQDLIIAILQLAY